SSACAVFCRYVSVLACAFVSVHRHVFRSLVCSPFASSALRSGRAICSAWSSAHRSPWARLVSYSRSQAAPEASSHPKAKGCLCVTTCAVTNPLRKAQFL
ncbi:hypothetical protein N326_04448, partial [Eurypyga helias]